MPLPAADAPWPPPEFEVARKRIATWSAWYSGDPDELTSVYGGTTTGSVRPSDRPSQYRGGVVGRIARWFWGQPTPDGEQRSKLHVPLAGDIAATSADLLFSEPVVLTAANEGDTATQDRLDELAEAVHAQLLQAAEVCAALGGVFLRVAWDREVDDAGPWLDSVHADAAVPEWRYGRLVAATFWRVIAESGSTVVRHLERHEPGVIEHAVYEGSTDKIGRPVPLTEYAETRPLAEALSASGVIETGTDLLTCAYVPNMRPNRLWRSLPAACHLGRSDYAGSEPLMDALDETWSSLMQELDLAKARAILPESMLQSLGPGQGAYFDAHRRYFVGMNVLQQPGQSGTLPIAFSQPSIRVEEHLRITAELMSRIVGMAGYSGRTFGLVDSSGAMTATEVDSRDRKSLITRDKKGLYWRPALSHMTQVLLQLGNEHFAWGVDGEAPTVRLADAVQPSLRERSEAVDMLHRAEAVSTQTRVEIAHPDWDDEQVQAEVARILAERGAAVPAADAFGSSTVDEDENIPADIPEVDQGAR